MAHLYSDCPLTLTARLLHAYCMRFLLGVSVRALVLCRCLATAFVPALASLETGRRTATLRRPWDEGLS